MHPDVLPVKRHGTHLGTKEPQSMATVLIRYVMLTTRSCCHCTAITTSSFFSMGLMLMEFSRLS